MKQQLIRGRGAAALIAVFVAIAATAGGASAATVAGGSGTPRVLTATPNDAAVLSSLLNSLRPGDILQLAPGIYRTGYLRFHGPQSSGPDKLGSFGGTALAPIVIRAADPANRPILVGGLQIWGASYWRLQNVRIQAAGAGFVALNLWGGVGWQVTGSEFYGARITGAITNVFIGGANGTPRAFQFSSNCVHDAALGATSVHTNHDIYVNYAGSGLAGGVISRNVIFNAPNGVGIKIGAGGLTTAIGPSGLRVAYNTIVNSGRQVLLTGNVRNNRIYANLFYGALTQLSGDSRTMNVYSNSVTGTNNILDHNYGFRASMLLWDPTHSIRLGVNAFSTAASANPLLRGGSICSGLVPTNPASTLYGARGTGRF